MQTSSAFAGRTKKVSWRLALAWTQAAKVALVFVLDEEEMKVTLDERGRMRRITKLMSPAEADGEYIGATLIEARSADALATALEATWRRDPDLYYEDGYQTLVDTGGEVGVAPIGALPWVEVDNHDDLVKAREIACRY